MKERTCRSRGLRRPRRVSRRGRAAARQLRATAHHEAGHAVMAELLAVPYTSVSVVPDEGDRGRMMLALRGWRREPDPFDPRLRGRIENLAMVLMAGFIAEEQFTGRANNVSATSDKAVSRELMERVAFSERECALHLEALFARCRYLMRSLPMRRTVAAVARALVDRGTLSRDEAAAVVVDAWPTATRRRAA